MRYSSILGSTSRYFIIFIASTLLLGCVSSGNNQPWEHKRRAPDRVAEQAPNNISVTSVEQHNLDPNTITAAPTQNRPTVKVAILLPLSGKHAKLGKSMLNAAQMALFDTGANNFELLPKDTKGTPNGARNAARSALQDGAKLVLGPIFSPSVKAARKVTESADINMIAFSTDWTLASRNTFLIGFLPFDQIERVVNYASNAGYRDIGVLSPNNNYGNAVVSAYNSIAQSSGVRTTSVERYSPKGNDLGSTIRKFANYDARRAAVKNGDRDILPFNAVIMPVGGTTARQVSSFLNHYDLPASKVKRLGTGLMDDASLASDKTLNGSWFAGPSPQSHKKFARRYSNIYTSTPPRIASLAYDATALAAILARTGMKQNNRPAYNYRAITNPNGFAGVDGIFRFRSNGIAERGLAILEYRNGQIVVIDKAPRTFQRRTF